MKTWDTLEIKLKVNFQEKVYSRALGLVWDTRKETEPHAFSSFQLQLFWFRYLGKQNCMIFDNKMK